MRNKALDILLINPRWNGFGYRKKIKASETRVHPLTLGIVAAIIKKHSEKHQIAIADQLEHENPLFQKKYDLVGISVNTYTAQNAYNLAGHFQKRKIPVVLGGVHASLNSEECLKFADAVLVGEAEDKLPELLDDLLQKRLKRKYVAESLDDLAKIPVPDRKLIRKPRADAAYVQATRGCNNFCKFCYLRNVPWAPYRKRPIAAILRELKELKEDIVLFVDDNMFIDRDFCLELLQGMRSLKKHWWAQAPTTLAYDDVLLQAVADSGCFCLSYGFQTVNHHSLTGDRIMQNRIDDYATIVKKTQAKGILVDGTFIFGFDGDREDVFDRTRAMIVKMNLDTYTFYLLTVYPGTPYFKEIKSQNRLCSEEYAKFDWDHAVLKPRHMPVASLENGIRRLYKRLDNHYRLTFWKRAAKNTALVLKSPKLAGFLFSAGFSRKYRNDY